MAIRIALETVNDRAQSLKRISFICPNQKMYDRWVAAASKFDFNSPDNKENKKGSTKTKWSSCCASHDPIWTSKQWSNSRDFVLQTSSLFCSQRIKKKVHTFHSTWSSVTKRSCIRTKCRLLGVRSIRWLRSQLKRRKRRENEQYPLDFPNYY